MPQVGDSRGSIITLITGKDDAFVFGGFVSDEVTYNNQGYIYISRMNNLFLSFDMKVVLLCEGSKEDFIHGLKPLRKRVRYFA